MSAPAIYEGTISHRRSAVRAYGFRHRLAMAYVDVAHVPARLTRARPGLLRFRRADYLGDPGVPLDQAVRDLVQQRTGARPEGPITLLTHLRTLGSCFNPVSFYYCFDTAGERVQTVVAEVTNTPWGERHAYVLRGGGHARCAKQLHVSPFFSMAQDYEWTAGEPGRVLSVHIANREGAERVFDAQLTLRRRPLTRATLAHHATSSLRVGVLIYAHAAALKLKGLPLHRHPGQAA